MNKTIDQGALKIIELIGVSQENFEDAVQQAVRRASSKLEGIKGVEVEKLTAKVESGSLVEYHANVKIAFVLQ